MKRGWLLNLAMLAAVAALAWFAWHTPSRDAVADLPLSASRPSQVRQVILQRPGQPALKLDHSGEQWRLTAPLNARADEFQVLRMLAILDARPTARLPAQDLNRFGLQSPVARLNVDGIEYAFGGINTVTREQYVLHDDTVYAVELRHGAGLPAGPGNLIRRVLLGENERPVAITLPGYSVRQISGNWTIAPPDADLGQEDLQRYIDRWRYASAVTAEAYDGRKPLDVIRMVMSSGATVEFGILQREPQLVLWRRDVDLQYHFLAAAGRVLLSRPATTPSADPKTK